MFSMLFEKVILPNIFEIGILLPMFMLGIETHIRTWSQPHVTEQGLHLGQSNPKAFAVFILFLSL